MNTEFQKLSRLVNLFQRVKQLSYTADRTSKRYPPLDLLTDTEIIQLKRDLLALGMDIEDIAEDWKAIYEKESDSQSSA